MRNDDKNFMIMAVCLVTAGLFSLCFYFRDLKQTDTVYVKDFPRTVGTWVSKEIPLSKDVLIALETDNVFFRKYSNTNGEEVYLFIVYSQNNHKTTHLPEICYRGNGVSFLEKTHDLIRVNYQHLTIRANRFLLQAGKLYQISFYWFKVGNNFTSDYLKEQILVAFNTLFGQGKGSALIRISADISNNDKEKAIKEVKEFTDLITPKLFKYLP